MSGLVERTIERYRWHADFGFAWWVPPLVALTAIVFVILGLVQRGAFGSPGRELVFGAVVVSPWIIEHLLVWLIPRFVFAAVVLAGAGALIADPASNDFVPFVLVLLAGEAGATSPVRTSAPIMLGGAAVMGALELAGRFEGSLIWMAGIAFGWALGLAIERQLHFIEQQQASTDALAAKAAVEERQRIAREIHDVVAHSLSVAMLHLTGARHVLESERDIDEAVTSLRQAEQVGRDALADIRRTVGLLDDDSSSRPLPDLADLPGLVSEFEAAGMTVDAEIDVDDPVAPATGLAAYRIVQEALTNAARHGDAPAAACRIRVRRGRLELEITNSAGQPAVTGHAGRGLRGMQQRAEMLGGDLRSDTTNGRWRVIATLPMTPPPEPADV